MAEVAQINAAWPKEGLAKGAHHTTYTLSPSTAWDFTTLFHARSNVFHRTFTFRVQSPNLYKCEYFLPKYKDHGLYQQVTREIWPTNIESFQAQWDVLTAEPLLIDSIDEIGSGEIRDYDQKVVEKIAIEPAKTNATAPADERDVVSLSLQVECQSNVNSSFERKRPTVAVWTGV
jgi:hypothetical protein